MDSKTIWVTKNRLNSDWHLYETPPSSDEIAIVLDGDEQGRVFIGEDAHLFFSDVNAAVRKLSHVAALWNGFVQETAGTLAAYSDNEVVRKTGWTGTEAQFVHWAIEKYGYGAFSSPDREEIIKAAQFVCSPEGHKPGPQEPPDDPRIFNRRQPDGSFRPLTVCGSHRA